MNRVQIIGAGLAGISAAITLAKKNIQSNLISLQPSERAQSVLAEGGINAALNTMNEADDYQKHYQDTLKAGCFIADEEAVLNMTKMAPEIVDFLDGIGVPFEKKDGIIQLRNFGGQKNKRTAYVKSSVGKSIMTALINEARKYEVRGLIHRYSNHEFNQLIIDADNKVVGVTITNNFDNKSTSLFGAVLLAFGGMSGLFAGETTGTTSNTSDALAKVFKQGVTLSNLEMIQYHPTTIGISGKRCLISEAARGEGARLFIYKNKKPWYFMEEKYPELGNLMPRDIISREIYFCKRNPECDNQVYLDLTVIDKSILESRLSDLCEEIIYYMGINPKKKPIPIDPAIHYFMGGIAVDCDHRANYEGLYAAGECCSQYHGANRLGGNSILGALCGGIIAANHISRNQVNLEKDNLPVEDVNLDVVRPLVERNICDILKRSLGIVRNENDLKAGILEIEQLAQEKDLNKKEINRTILAKAILLSALYRKESRGAHYREDYPELDEGLRKTTVASYKGGIKIGYNKEGQS